MNKIPSYRIFFLFNNVPFRKCRYIYNEECMLNLYIWTAYHIILAELATSNKPFLLQAVH